MLEFAISIALGVAVAFAWMAVWVVALRAFGIQLWMPTPESRSAKRLRILQMGKLRYILSSECLAMELRTDWELPLRLPLIRG